MSNYIQLELPLNNVIISRFESVLTSKSINPSSIISESLIDLKPLIFPVDRDLYAFSFLLNLTKIQNGGILCFPTGITGIGKTTSVYSASIYLNNQFSSVIPVNEKIDLRDIPNWLRSNLPEPTEKSLLLLFDGREATDDIFGLTQLLTYLNQLLRRRSDIVACWPTVDSDWSNQIRERAVVIGGNSFVPQEGLINIEGVPKIEWQRVLERMLLQKNFTFDELAITDDILNEQTKKHQTLGEFLTGVRSVVTQNFTIQITYKNLPQIVFVITSDNKVRSVADNLRKVDSDFRADPHRILNYSKKSKQGRWWSARTQETYHNLPYIVNLFNVRLTTMTESAVVYASLHFGDESISRIVRDNGMTRNRRNAGITLETTDLYRFLSGQPVPALTHSGKGHSASSTTKKAFSSLQQKLSNDRGIERAVNNAICSSIENHLPGFDKGTDKEQDVLGNKTLYPDKVINMLGQEYYLEFHHVSAAHCTIAEMAKYIMEKLQHYAIEYNVIPR